jgi:hypothetical protein
MDHNSLHSIQEEPWWTEDCLNNALFREVRQLRPSKIGRLEALVTFMPEVVHNEEDEVAIDSACGHSKALLRLALLTLCEVGPGEFHLLIHPTHEHRMLRSGGHALEYEERCDLGALERLELLVNETENARWDASQRIREGILQSLDGTQPKDSIHTDPHAPELLKLSRVHEILVSQV